MLKREAVQKAINNSINLLPPRDDRPEMPDTTQLDFGNHIFPTMLAMKQEVLAYPFNGAYQDAGNILAYWRLKKDSLQDKKA